MSILAINMDFSFLSLKIDCFSRSPVYKNAYSFPVAKLTSDIDKTMWKS